MAKNYQTGLIITGDAKGAIKATALTEDALKRLNGSNKRASKQMQGSWAKANQSMLTVKKSIGAVAAAAAALGAIGGIRSIVSDMDKIGKLSTRLGMTTEALSEMQHVAALSGVSFETMTMGMQRMTKRVGFAAAGTGEAVSAFKALNLEAATLSKMRPEDQYLAIADALHKVSNSSQQVALSAKIYDSEGVALLQTMTNGAAGIKAMREEAAFLGLTLSNDMTSAAASANDNMTRLGVTFDVMGIKLTNELIPHINDAVTALLDLFNMRPEKAVALDNISQLVGQVDLLEKKLKSGVSLGRNAGATWSRYRELSADLMTAKFAAEQFGASQAQINRALGLATTEIEKTNTATSTFVSLTNQATAAQMAFNKSKSEALSLTNSMRTPQEVYAQNVAKITDLRNADLISLETYNRAVNSYQEALNKASAASLTNTELLDQSQLKDELDRAFDLVNEYLDRDYTIALTIDNVDFGTDLTKMVGGLDAISGIGGKFEEIARARTGIADALKKELAAQKKLNPAQDEYILGQKKIQKYQQDDANLVKYNNDLKVQGYADMLGAASNTFNNIAGMMEEGSTQQKAMQATAMVAQTALNVALGIGAIASASMTPFIGFATGAAMAVQMAALGINIAGMKGSGPDAAKLAQENQGSGSVLGDAEAKSESFANSIDLLADSSDLSLKTSNLMLRQLEMIQGNTAAFAVSISGSSSFAGFGAQAEAARSGSIQNTGAHNYAAAITGLGLFSVKAKAKIKDSGIEVEAGTLGEFLADELTAQYFADIESYHVGIFGGRRKKRKDKNFSVSGEIEGQLGNELDALFSSTADLILQGSSLLLDTTKQGVINQVGNLDFDIGRISLKGLDAEEMEKAVSETLSKAFDEMALAVVPELASFQRIGEGTLETLVRVSSGVEQAESALNQLGIEAINYTDIANKQLDVDSEIARQSLLLVSEFDNLSSIMTTAAGTASELVDLYIDLNAAQRIALNVGFDDNAITSASIGASGGLSELQSNLEAFNDFVLSDTEKFDNARRNFSADFDDLGTNYTVPKTIQDFDNLVRGIDTTSESGQQLWARMLSLTPAFSELTEMMTTAEEAIEQLSVDFKALAQEALDALKRSVEESKTLLTERYNAEKDLLQDNYDNFLKVNKLQEDAAKESLSSIENIASSLKSAIESTVIESAELTRIGRLSAQSALRAALLASNNGVSLSSVAGLDVAIENIQKPSENLFSTFEDYARDQGITAGLLTGLSNNADAQTSVAQLTLDAITGSAESMKISFDALRETNEKAYTSELERLDSIVENAQLQLDALLGIDNSILSLAEAISAFDTSLSKLPASTSSTISTPISTPISIPASSPIDIASSPISGNAYSGTGKEAEDFLINLWGGGSKVGFFANGGVASGWSVVGEEGPELVNFDNPGRVYTAGETRSALGGSSNKEVVAELRQLREELKAANISIAKSTHETARKIARWDGDGMPGTRVIA